jgi:hypothetical protein
MALSPDDLRKVMMAHRRVFNSAEGRLVLTYWLNELGFFTNTGDDIKEIDIEKMKIARQMLSMCGAWEGQDIGNIVDALMDRPPVLPVTRSGSDE